MTIKYFFDFPRKNIFSRDDQHLFDASGDKKMTIAVNASHIACAKKTILVKDCFGFLWQIPISHHHVGSLDANLTFIACGNIFSIGVDDSFSDILERASDTAPLPFFGEAPVGDRRCFGQAISLTDSDAKAFEKSVGNCLRQGFSPTDHISQAGEIFLRCIFDKSQCSIHRRYCNEHSWSMGAC